MLKASMRGIFAAILRWSDIVARMKSVGAHPRCKDVCGELCEESLSGLEGMRFVFLCLGVSPASQERIVRPRARGNLHVALDSDCLKDSWTRW